MKETRFTIALRKARAEAMLTQRQLADALGVTVPAVSKWECGTAYPRAGSVAALVKVLGNPELLAAWRSEPADVVYNDGKGD
jgi:transcriptional regulator with XRE-family HTH domain